MGLATNIKVRVPGRSSFDKSFKNILTARVGGLTPLVSKYVMPGSKGSLKLAISAALPPLASDTFMRADLKVEAFLCPYRLLYGGFESWLTDKKLRDNTNSTYVKAELPRLRVGNTGYAADVAHMGPGSLADYLGLRVSTDANFFPQSPSYYNIFPFLAYHYIWDTWYRNPRLTNPLFSQPVGSAAIGLSSLPYHAHSSITNWDIDAQFPDATHLYDLRSRNYGADYFTIATPSAQLGSAQSVAVSSNAFTIQALREANSLQQFAERSNLGSPRLQDYVRAHFGADLSAGIAQRPILLGSASYPVYSKGVYSNSGVTATNNPFTSVGAQYGQASASGIDFVCNFECNEPSQLMVLVSLVPEANYGSGIDHEFFLLNAAGAQVDLPDPLLENTGNEPIYGSELSGFMFGSPGGVPSPGAVFGYVPKNSWHKCSRNEVHGLLRAGESLDSFVAQRAVTVQPAINTSFARIHANDLDNVTAVTAELSQYGCWIDSFVDLKVSEPLSESAMPSLQDPSYEHGQRVVLNQVHAL